MINKNWILHDYLQVNGGAERLVITIAKGLPNFTLGISGIYPNFKNLTSLNGIEYTIFSNYTKILPRIPRALTTFTLQRPEISNSKLVIYSGIYTPLAHNSQNDGKKIYYCHTLPRFAFDLELKYLNNIQPLIRPLVKNIINHYRKSYIKSLNSMTNIYVNSRHTQKNIDKYAGLKSNVIYPPIETKKFKWNEQGNYYLSLGRLESKKRIELIIKAFIKMPKRNLIVTSGGSQYLNLKKLANNASNIYFTNWVTDKELISLIANSIACIYIPADEDFGMSAVESMAAGKPIITVAEGGISESVIDGETGFILPPDPTIDILIDSINKMSKNFAQTLRKSCENQAKNFSKDKFLEKLKTNLF